MVIYKGKEITQEEFDKIVEDASNTSKLVKGYDKKIEDLTKKAVDGDKVTDLEKQLKDKEDEVFKMKLTDRLKTVSKYIESKENDKTLIQKIGEYTDEDFELFSEGKTDDEFKSKDEIESVQKDLDQKKIDLETNKDKIIDDAIKARKTEEEKADDQKVVPPGEIEGDKPEDKKEKSKYPTIDTLIDLYELKDDPAFDTINDKTKSRSASYIKRMLDE